MGVSQEKLQPVNVSEPLNIPRITVVFGTDHFSYCDVYRCVHAIAVHEVLEFKYKPFALHDTANARIIYNNGLFCCNNVD